MANYSQYVLGFIMNIFNTIIITIFTIITGGWRGLEGCATDITTLASPNIELDLIVIIVIVIFVNVINQWVFSSSQEEN